MLFIIKVLQFFGRIVFAKNTICCSTK